MYFQGQGVKVSYPKALLWWRLAEDLNIDVKDVELVIKEVLSKIKNIIVEKKDV